LKVQLRGVVRLGGRDRLAATIDPPIDGEHELWFELRGGEVELLESADPFAIALLPIAASRGLSVEIDGPLSPSLLFPLDEASRCLELTTRANPRHAHWPVVEISATSLEERTRADPRAAVAALSGGVDSVYTLARHRHLLPSDVRLDARRSVLVHGFDIPMADDDSFGVASTSAERITELAGSALVLVATNFRAFGSDWPMSHGAAVAAALTCVSDGLGTGLIASSLPYDDQDIPWGSAPFLDHLFSSASFQIAHDGSVANRLEKIRTLTVTWPEVVPHLRFCSRGGGGSNCGQCAPCVLTMVMFGLCGSACPPFVHPPTAAVVEAALRRVPMNNMIRRRMQMLIGEADRQGIRPHWYRTVKRRLHEDALRRAVRPYVPEVARRLRRSTRRLTP